MAGPKFNLTENNTRDVSLQGSKLYFSMCVCEWRAGTTELVEAEERAKHALLTDTTTCLTDEYAHLLVKICPSVVESLSYCT